VAIANDAKTRIIAEAREAEVVLVQQWVPVTTPTTAAGNPYKKSFCFEMVKPTVNSIIIGS
jgi:hypothetical protein